MIIWCFCDDLIICQKCVVFKWECERENGGERETFNSSMLERIPWLGALILFIYIIAGSIKSKHRTGAKFSQILSQILLVM